MAKIKNIVKKNIADKIICLMIISLAGVLLYVGLQSYTDTMYQYFSKSFKKGQIAEADLLVSNSIDLYDEEATEALKNKNAKAVLPIFNHSIQNSLATIEKFDVFKRALELNDYSLVSTLSDVNVSSYLQKNDYTKILAYSYEIIKEILDSGFYNSDELQKALNDGYRSIVEIKEGSESTVSLDSYIITDHNINQAIDRIIAGYEQSDLTLNDAVTIKSIVVHLLKNNVSYDELLTESRRNSAIENTQPVYISFEKGQILLAKDKVVTEEQLNMIKLLGNNTRITANDVIGESFFIVLTMVFSLFLLCYFLDAEKYHQVQYLWITTIALVLTCGLSFFSILKANSYGIVFVESFVPVCFAPVLITMITGKREYGYVTSFIVGLLISATPGSTYLTTIYCTISGISSCAVVRFFNKRTDMFVQWLLSFCITSALTALFIYIGSFSNREILYDLIGNAIHITLTQILIAIILPVLERIFNLPTVFRLNELAYGNNPLLSKLSETAPGTYSHSKMVAELSESAAKAIGSNALLARVGGLYHDIGKTEHPEYFVENQSGTNRHQDLNPSLSVSIIKSHVKVGADKGREAGLPVELIDIIANHHGTDIIAYFYNEAKKQADEDDVVSSIDYSYSTSSIPETKECAIVMLADSVEAAARTVAEPTAAKFTKLINSIVFGKIERGQLDNCDISMKEIDVIKESFLKAISAQHHNRIEYPDEEKNELNNN